MNSSYLFALQPADAEARRGARARGHERHRQVDGAEDHGRQAEAEPRALRQLARLEGDHRVLPRLRAAELLHAPRRGQPEAAHQTAIRRPDRNRPQNTGNTIYNLQ